MVTHEVKRLLIASELRERFNISNSTLRRWLRAAELNFPQPKFFGGWRYWLEEDVFAFEARLNAMRNTEEICS